MKNKIISLIKKYTKHKYVYLAERGNQAILVSLKIIKEKEKNNIILIQDQGGWMTYSQFANKLKFNLVRLKTDYGLIIPEELKKKLNGTSAILYQNPAGYFAEQPVKKIYDTCKGKCNVILDISGCIGNIPYLGNYADIMVGSFGRWKPINLEYGGFISFNHEKYLNESILKDLKFDNSKFTGLYEKLADAKKKYEYFEKINKRIKIDLKNFAIIHKYKKGINVLAKFNTGKEKDELIDYCETNKYPYLICPKNIRVEENAISIEVKRL